LGLFFSRRINIYIKKNKSTEIPYLGGAEGRADGHDDAPDNADVTMHLIVEV
jgi:hypothetical protein